MKVIIREREVEYTPDYPDGWQKKGRDPFKSGVILNNTACFIKRFETGDSSYVTGWNMLVKLKGKNTSNLQRIFDIRQNMENGRPVSYVFYEFEEGRTLDTIGSLRNLQDIERLSEDLFAGLTTMKDLGFWFPDYTEKNLLWNKDGKTYFLDLDSTHPILTMPKNGMEGSKDYWITVRNFYHDILNKKVSPSQLNGNVLNWLQTIFLLLHFKVKLQTRNQQGEDRKKEFFEFLPGYLANTLPASKMLFMECAAGTTEWTPDLDKKIKSLCSELIKGTIDLQQIPKEEPGEKTKDPEFDDSKQGVQSRTDEKSFLSADVKKDLELLARRMKIYANWSLVLLAIVVLGSASRLATYGPVESVATLLVIAFTMIIIYPVRYLTRSSISIKQFIKYNDEEQWKAAFSSLKTYFSFMMVYRVLVVMASIVLLLSMFIH